MEQVLYVKYSNERDERFQIRTEICEDNGHKFVKKYAQTDKAVEHLENMFKHYELLKAQMKDTKFKVNDCHWVDRHLEFEYIEGLTLEQIIDQKMRDKDYDGVRQLVLDFYNELNLMADETFQISEEFVNVFGEVEFDKPLKACSVCDIDLIFRNIIVKDNVWYVIDYEWTFDFLVPVDYVMYRAIIYHGTEHQDLLTLNLFNLLKIYEKEIELYCSMENCFQQYVSGKHIFSGCFLNSMVDVNALIKENEQIKLLVQTQKCEVEKSKEMLNEKEALVTELKNTLDTFNKESTLKITTLEKDIAQQKENYNVVVAQNDDLMNQLNQVTQMYLTISNSTCWKVTKPVRKTLDYIKEKRKQFNIYKSTQMSTDVNQNIMDNEKDISVMTPPETTSKHAGSLAYSMPESVIHNRIPVEKMVEELDKYDVVSFDIFDTLIFRVFNVPKDVFRMMAHEMRLEGFYRLRIAAEEEARKYAQDKNGEITIYDIYQVLNRTININIEEGVLREIKAEKRVCIPNKYMQNVYNALQAKGKKLVFTSDMYLPKQFLYELLTNCGYKLDADDIYVSCEHACNKGSGQLQLIAFNNNCENGKSFIHVGDNWVADIERTKAVGLGAFYYESCHDIGNKFRPENFDGLSNSVYSALVNQHLHADEIVYSAEYEHGFKFAGYLTCGFCEWLNEYAKNNGIDKFLFLARDTDVISKVYNQFYREVDNDYMVVSRMATRIMSFEKNPAEYLQYFLKTRAEVARETISMALVESDLKCLIPFLKEHNLSGDMILDMTTYETLYKLGCEKQKIIAQEFSNSKYAGYNYIKTMIGSAKKVCLIDLGWSGQIITFLREIIDDCMNGTVETYGVMIAANESENANTMLEANILDTYLFSSIKNRHLIFKTDTFEGNMFARTMEATFTSSMPSLIKYNLKNEDGYKFLYGVKTSDVTQIEEIQKGILDFASQYNVVIRQIDHTKKIYATDAFKPYLTIKGDFLYAYRMFKDNLEKEDSLPSVKGKEVYTTLGEIMKKWNLV